MTPVSFVLCRITALPFRASQHSTSSFSVGSAHVHEGTANPEEQEGELGAEQKKEDIVRLSRMWFMQMSKDANVVALYAATYLMEKPSL